MTETVCTIQDNALVSFDSLEVGDWFVFPEAIERLVAGGVSDKDRHLSFTIKTGPFAAVPSELLHKELLRTIPMCPKRMVVRLEKPNFMFLG